MQNTIHNRDLFLTDNLEVLRRMDSKSFDLIYLDPPFNKNRSFTKPIGSTNKKVGFDDIFREESIKDEWLFLIAKAHPKVFSYIRAVGNVGHKTNKNYLCFMAIRLIECHRVLKDTGSLYLHCDDTMGSHLKLLLDWIFGEFSFRNHITWKRSTSIGTDKSLGNVKDWILYYSKSKHFTWNKIFVPITEEYKKAFSLKDDKGFFTAEPLEANKAMQGGGSHYTYQGYTPERGWLVKRSRLEEMDQAGRLYWTRGGKPRRKTYLREKKGSLANNLWIDIPNIQSSKEATGYKTQKPIKLLQRIIQSSSNEGDWVLDPFCGCATTCVAAELLKRNWVGIDCEPTAHSMIVSRFTKRAKEGELPFQAIKLITPRGDLPERTDLPKKHFKRNEMLEILFGRQWGKCNGCLHSFDHPRHFHIDHIQPKSKGGSDDISNRQLLCGSCNYIKGDRDMAYLKAKLKELGILP